MLRFSPYIGGGGESPDVAESLNVGGNVTGPGAVATIATLGVVPLGIYEIRVRVSVGAGALAADNGNMQLFLNNVIDMAALPTNGDEVVIPRRSLNGANSVLVRSVGAGTAAVVYTASITATQVE
jgi:hypothetical protein